MQYMCLIYDDEQVWQGMSEDEQNAVFGEYGAFTESIQESGNMVAGDALSRPRRRRPCASGTARRSSPTAPSPRRRSSSAATT